MIAFETEVKHVAAGDTVISPISGRKMLVRSTEPTDLYGLIDLHCLDSDGEYLTMTLDPDEKIKVMSE